MNSKNILSYDVYVNSIKDYTIQQFMTEDTKLTNEKKSASSQDKIIILQKIIILRQMFHEKYSYLYL
jgi:hypothetical protein